jgi:hypothetical protein
MGALYLLLLFPHVSDHGCDWKFIYVFKETHLNGERNGDKPVMLFCREDYGLFRQLAARPADDATGVNTVI